ncbi:MAG: DUF5686 and carboxypeptidase regulatory-like domain-containing protein [Cytophagales bacterium]|nr:DUF5686 and carboxypeptidase regulatory-like domain-containing protein [Cytophagales bacterium]
MRTKIIYIFLLSLLASVAFCQKFIVEGQVLEAKTNEPVPFANIRMKIAKTGMTADENGNFSFYSEELPDSLIISEVGFKVQSVFLKIAPVSKIIILLEEDVFVLDEALVIGYKDPGKSLMRKVLENRDRNDLNRARNFVRNNYTKTEIDVKNLKAGRKESLFGEVLATYNGFNTDTTQKDILPLYFNESYYNEFHGTALRTVERIKLAEKNLGLPTDKLGVKLDRFEMNLNLYDGLIPILKTSFVSPVSVIGLAYYDFKILDTTKLNNENIYNVYFKPKMRDENTFEGKMVIMGDSYAIGKFEMKSSEGMNLNFVNSISFTQEFEKTLDINKRIVYILKHESNTIDFQASLDLFGIPIKEDSTSKHLQLIKNLYFDHYQLDAKGIHENTSPDFVPGILPDSSFKDSMRLVGLSSREQGIYNATAALLANKRLSRFSKAIDFMASGVFDFNNKYRIGPYSSFISSNVIEGIRHRVSFWTMEGLNDKLNFNATLAYGWKDNMLKGGVGFKYVPSREPYRKTEFFYNKDYDNSTEVNEEIDKDNIFTLALRKNIPNYQVLNEEIKLLQEIDLNHNWSTRASFSYRSLTPTFDFKYFIPTEAIPSNRNLSNRLTLSEVSLNFRYAHNERTRIYNYDKFRIYSRYPIFDLFITQGFKISGKTPFNYTKVEVALKQVINLLPKGTFNYNLKAGRIFGTVPYILMNTSHGNPNFIYSKYAFNNMNPYEFAGDKYASAQFKYSMGGLIFDKVPLLRKLNWRERFLANFYWSDMSKANLAYNKEINSPAIVTGKKPYGEVGAGIENIFNLFSVDAVWRLSHLDNPNNLALTRFGIYTGMKIVF